MSRNFELLEQLGTELEVRTAPTPILNNRIKATEIISASASERFQSEIRRLVHRVFMSANGKPPGRVVFCGVDAGNGSTSVCASAARVLAASTSKFVCVVEGNSKMPRLSVLFGTEYRNATFGETLNKLQGCTRIGTNLWIAGPDVLFDGTGSLRCLNQLSDRLVQLSNTFDFVLIDAPGVNVREDTLTMGQLVDAAILVIDANRTRRLTARKVFETLDRAGIKLLGAVLHDRSFPIPQRLYQRL